VKKHLASFLKLAISLGLGVGLIYWFVSKMTPEDVALTKDAFSRANYFWILLAPVLGFVSNFSRTERWRMLLEPTGHRPGFWNTYFSVMLMYFFNLLFPRLGEVTRCSILARYENVPLDKSIGTMVVERIVDLISIILVGSLVLFVEYDTLYAYFNETVLNKKASEPTETSYLKWIILGSIILICLGGAFFVQHKYGFARMKAMLIERLKGFAEGLKSIRYLRQPFMFVFHSVFIWVCYFLMVYFSFYALPETASLGAFAGLACLFMGGFAMVATPGGIGVYPAMIAQVLVLYGINATIGYAFGSIVWVAQTGSVLIGGALSLLLVAIINRGSSLAKN
jgi:uncharacterized membrane protein YbhN (UPF0104 family)